MYQPVRGLITLRHSYRGFQMCGEIIEEKCVEVSRTGVSKMLNGSLLEEFDLREVFSFAWVRWMDLGLLDHHRVSFHYLDSFSLCLRLTSPLPLFSSINTSSSRLTSSSPPTTHVPTTSLTSLLPLSSLFVSPTRLIYPQ